MNEEWPTNPADKEPEIDEVFEYCGELEIKLAAQRIRIAELAAAESMVRELAAHVRLAEHKVDQHLQGQYNNPPYPALGTALAELRKALSRIPAHLRAPENTSTGESSTVLRQEGE